jgi:hypothetical protein
MTNGSVADKLRLVSAGYDVPRDETEKMLSQLENLLNKDGGLPFNLRLGNPSSVKETAEILMLLKPFVKAHASPIENMSRFLVSRQKRDGGFAEALNLDPHIESKFGGTGGRDWYPVGKSITWLTGKALEALCNVGFEDQSRLKKARDYLMGLQNEDGHWPDFKGHNESDPLGTGNILPALAAVGVTSQNKIYKDGRAALMQHLKSSLEQKLTHDMVDLAGVPIPESDLEKNIIRKGVELVLSAQSTDGGWCQMGMRKSDPELTSLLVFAAMKCGRV